MTFAQAIGIIGSLGAATIVATPSAVGAQAQIPPSIEFRVPKAPTVAVSDSGAFVAYELHVTNLTSTPMTLRRVEVIDDASHATVMNLADSALLRVIVRPAPVIPAAQRAKIGAGLRAYVYLWIPVDAAHPPATLRHRLTFRPERADSTKAPADSSKAQPPDTTLVVLEGTVTPVAHDVVVISPPVRGEWAAFNGPSNSSGHRRLVLGLDGHVAIGQRFAIDFLQVDSTGNSHHGDPSKNENYYAYGTPLLAVADGIVVETRDSIPQNVPGVNSRAVPITMVTVGGNHVAIDIGHGRYALYAHVQPGSLRVKVGDHVKRGQVVALLGNSGNSTEPHVHFQIADGPTFLSSEGIPYATDFDVIGNCGVAGTPPAIVCSRHTPTAVKGGIPLMNELVRFPK
ncbi:MAG TPA: M23 family metallopeptidase [Gemmatimonadaceae bacterium]|nr:M23 family metallopeptidase [Gemmatimonadaceae bacterium]